jgi:16S rRNA (guanine527-N7)-methyltransferase
MEKNFCEQLTGKASLLGVQLTKEQAGQLWTYYQMLLEKNKVMNLTAITEEEEVITKHFLDSMSIVRCLAPGEWDNPAGLSLIDVGTGAGFPGMVLKIVFPALEVTLFVSLFNDPATTEIYTLALHDALPILA